MACKPLPLYCLMLSYSVLFQLYIKSHLCVFIVGIMFILTENNILLDILKSTGREAGGALLHTNLQPHKLSSDFFLLMLKCGQPDSPGAGRVGEGGWRAAPRGLLSYSLAGVFVPVAQVPNLTRAVRERIWMKCGHLGTHPAGILERQHYHCVLLGRLWTRGPGSPLGPP